MRYQAALRPDRSGAYRQGGGVMQAGIGGGAAERVCAAPRCHARPLLLTAPGSGRGWLCAPIAVRVADRSFAKKADEPSMSSATLSILAAAAAGSPPTWTTFIPFVGMGLVFYFLLLRPQMQQQKKQRAKIEAIKKGDQVVTAGGLLAKVIKVDGLYVDLELGPNVKVRAVKATVSDVLQPGGAPAND